MFNSSIRDSQIIVDSKSNNGFPSSFLFPRQYFPFMLFISLLLSVLLMLAYSIPIVFNGMFLNTSSICRYSSSTSLSAESEIGFIPAKYAALPVLLRVLT